ncbi:M48 family metallopeptidase [Candidatus Raskinella chloraquaticus]
MKALFRRGVSRNRVGGTAGPPPRATLLRVDLGGQDCVVTLRRSLRSRRLTLRLSNATGAVTVTAPPQLRLSAITAFIDRHRPWIVERLTRQPQRLRFTDGAVVPLRGIPHRLRESGDYRGRVQVEEGEYPCLVIPGDTPHVERRLVDFLKAEARRDLERAVATYTALTGTSAARLVLRDGSSRWGSCAANGALSFSWRLILAPPLVLDYVAAHEVAHLKHMNHGPNFWRLLNEICPGTAAAKAWMSANGASLHAYGPPPGPRRAVPPA